MVIRKFTYRVSDSVCQRLARLSSAMLVFILFLGINPLLAKASHFATLSVSQKSVMTGQAFNVRITVYTPTWFTKAPNFGEYQVKNSFTLKSDRARSLYETINGKRYTTLYYEYHVFPLQAGTLDLPPVNVQFESPEEGDYKGKLIKVTTKGASIEVIPLPGNADNTPLFVAKNVTLKQYWNKPTTNLIVGDVLERTICISTTGALANMIPPTQIDTLTWASIYMGKPNLLQSISDKNISSERKEKYTYLLEDEGAFKIPEVELSFFNINTKKWVTRKLSSRDINIADNPDLYALKTLQDSLDTENAAPTFSEVKEATILGMSIKTFLMFLLGLFMCGAILFWGWKRFFFLYKDYKERHLESEGYHFRQLTKVLSNKDYQVINEKLYRWISKLDSQSQITSLTDLALCVNNELFMGAVNEFHENMFGKQSIKGGSYEKDSIKRLKQQLIKSRRTWFQLQKNQQAFAYTINRVGTSKPLTN